MMTLALQLLIQSLTQRIRNKEQNAVGEKVMALESNARVCMCACVCAALTGWQCSLILTCATYLVSVQH